MPAFMEDAEQTLYRLGTDKDVGLSDAQVTENAERYGINRFTREKPKSVFRRVFEAAREPMILMLIATAFIALFVNIARAANGDGADFLECIGISVAISLSIVITVVMEGRSAEAFETLRKFNEDTFVKVLRNGVVLMIPQKDVVVGDILHVGTGDRLPADGRLIESVMLYSDESSLTGESDPVRKDATAFFDDEMTPIAERRNILYSGSFITGGHGTIVVTEVGDSTEFGKIAGELSKTIDSSTPLQEKLARLGRTITILGVCAAALVFIIQIATFIMNGTANLENVSDAFITSIVLIVAAVPEGLPTIVAVSLSLNIIKMSKQNALVKKMIASETIGSVNIICSDKTGTLTENRMTVSDVFSRGMLIRPASLTDTDMLNNFCLNSTADVNYESGRRNFIGNPTEGALLVAAKDAGADYITYRKSKILDHVFPFSSETKNMTSVIKNESSFVAYTKGSPEKILDLCEIDADIKASVENEIVCFQKKAGRVLAFAHKEFSDRPDYENDRPQIESKMVFDGFAVITDPLRTDVYESVGRCRKAGIDVKILTGDNIVTATAIANSLDLLGESHIAVEARTLEDVSDDELIEMLPQIRVVARSTPLIKMRVVNALKASGNVVAVTGDGINDAPAIRNADVGVAMGISGTDVSKEASDIVLLDDSFSTIVTAVQWGRGIYENFKRFIQFQLTVNLSSVVVVLMSIIIGFHSPFTALQLLWINIIMDGPPALTLGLEPINDDLMERRPVPRDSNIVSRDMMVRIITNGVFISTIIMSQNIWNFMGATIEQGPTVLFTMFVMFQLFNAFNSRELTDASIFRNLSNNRLMLAVFALTFGLQLIITQFGGAFFGTVALPMEMWIKMTAVAFTIILFSEMIKVVKRARTTVIAEKTENAVPPSE